MSDLLSSHKKKRLQHDDGNASRLCRTSKTRENPVKLGKTGKTGGSRSRWKRFEARALEWNEVAELKNGDEIPARKSDNRHPPLVEPDLT